MKKICSITLAFSILWLSNSINAQSVKINEIMYNFGFNLDKLESGNWIEMYNTTNTPVNLSGWQIHFGTAQFTISSGSIPANGFIVASSKDSLMAVNYPSVPLLGESVSGGLDDKSETIKIFNSSNVLVDEVTYFDDTPWPDCADGTGQTLSLSSTSANNDLPTSWVCSGTIGGTPGVANSVGCSSVQNVIINELNYKSSSANDAGDWIELHNLEGSPVNVSGWYVMDSDTLYIIPPNTSIAAGGFLVVASEKTKFGGIHNSLANSPALLGSSLMSFSGNGEQIALLTNNRCMVDELNYNDSAPWPTEPDGDGPTMALINPSFNNKVAGSWASSAASGDLLGTPAASNNIPNPCSTAPPALVINELNYDSDGANNPSNWIEIYNPGTSPVNLTNYKINNKGEQYKIPSGTTIGAMDYLVFADSLAKFDFVIECPPANLHQANTYLNFGNGGDLVSIYSFVTNDYGCLIDSVRYNDKAPWPATAAGTGNTLELINTSSDNTIATNWAASNFYLGSPGIANQQATATVCPCDNFNITKTGNQLINSNEILKAENNILISTLNYLVNPGVNVKFTAGNCIEIKEIQVPAAASTNFIAEIKNCQ